MKEATGEVSMTVITLVAIGIIGGLVALMWPNIKSSIEGMWNNKQCPAGQEWKAGVGCTAQK